MKTKIFTLKVFIVIFAFLLPCFTFSQTRNGVLFDSSWYGFNTGSYPNGQSPSAVKAGDLDNDGDSDLVVAQQNFSNGFVVLINQLKGIYASPVKYNSSKASQGIVIADFNGDNRKDVALTNIGQNFDGNSVSVYLNTGRGKFSAAVNYTVGEAPVGIVAADFDNDGDQDLAVCNSVANNVSLLINQGSGVFNVISFPAGNQPFRITAAKINNDNLIDLVVANNTQNVNILFNSGNNNFSSRLTLNVIYNFEISDANATVKSADFDNDGDNDIIFSSAQTYHTLNEIAFFTNNGTGTFNSPAFITLNAFSGSAADLDVADFNNDGRQDILTCYSSARVGDGYQVLVNMGNNQFAVPEVKPAGQSTPFITAADVDNDHKIDVVTSDFYSLQVTVHKNAGNAKFPVPTFYDTKNSSAGSLDAADIDGDGDLDLVTSASSVAAVGVIVTVLKNNGNGSFTPGVAYSIRGGGVQAKFRDLNGDGKPDLIFATAVSTPPYDFHTAINNGNGTFGPRQTWSMNACGWSDIEAIDVDNDGDNDAVISEWLGCMNDAFSARRIFISKNNGQGAFSSPIIKVINPFPSCIAAGDFNKDGKIDIATGQSLSIDVHLNSGNATIFNPPVSYATDQSPYDILVRDFNKDGNLDIAACTEYNFEGMSVLLGNGNGTFELAQNYKGAYSPDLRNESGITSGDVDGDGDEDILVGNYASNDVSIYLNNGNGTFTFKLRAGIYYGVESPIYADFTGDGKKDIAALISLPPSGIGSSLAILRGRVLNNAISNVVANNSETITIKNDNGISVLNNPFNTYIDIQFEKAFSGKAILQLTDMQGRQVATQQNVTSQSVIRFNLNNKVSSGMYILTVIMNDKKYSVKVFKQ